MSINQKQLGTYHCPTNERDYLRSPDKDQWRNAKELKMDEYNAIHMFDLVSRDEAIASGFPIMGSLWAYAIKFDEKGTFIKLNPRWCIMGGDMPKDIYEPYADVVRIAVVKVYCCLRATYRTINGKPLVSFHLDEKNAFQATRLDKPGMKSSPCYCEQAPGFRKRDNEGNTLV